MTSRRVLSKSRVRPERLAFALLSALWLGGCVRFPSLGEAPRFYELAPNLAARSVPRQPVVWQLAVDEPTAPAALDTDRIALRPNPLQIEYYGHARWADPVPKMVQRLLIKGFEQSGRIVGVGAAGMGLRADYELHSELWNFTANYRGGSRSPTVRVRLVVKIMREADGTIIAMRSFAANVPAASDTMGGVTEAFDRALGRVIDAVVPWVLAAPRSRSRLMGTRQQ